MKTQLAHLEDLFWNAKQLAKGSDRDQFVRNVEDRDPDLARELRELLRHDENSDRLFGELSLDEEQTPSRHLYASSPSDSQESPLPVVSSGSQVGPYKLLESIGEGGMGIVFLAHQSAPVRRKVALKIIKPGMDSRHVIARFETERQALALMNHPNIARVLDAGTTETGLPYFVMELVQGIPITKYCVESNLSTVERLKLFCDACSAIQHAHSKGIIHRDIKPSNVMVTEQDGRPLIKVIDFGVAKALTDELTDKTMFTGLFQILGTPLYMSPEQASLSNVDVDTRSDVYSLGVLLYELLCGTLPIDRQEAKRLSFDELRHKICDTVPPRPSKRVTTLSNRSVPQSGQRPNNRIHVGLTIDSDLDWIVMKAIDKDREHRYQSPSELAADIQRFLCGDAILAHPPKWTYRTRKYILKHQSLLTALACILGALLVGAGIAVAQAMRAHESEKIAIANEALAQKHASELRRLLYSRDMQSAATLYMQGDMAALQEILTRHATTESKDLRGFEWQFLSGLPEVPVETVYDSKHRINDLVLDPASGAVVVADSNGNLIEIDPSHPSDVHIKSSEQSDLLDLVLLPDSQLLSCGDNGEVVLWRRNAESGRWKEVQRRRVSARTLASLAADPSTGRFWVAGNDQHVYQGHLPALATRSIAEMPGTHPIRSLSYSQHGQLLVGNHRTLIRLVVDKPDVQTSRENLKTEHWKWDLPWDASRINAIAQFENGQEWIAAQNFGLLSRFGSSAGEQTVEPILEHSQPIPSGIHSIDVSDDNRWMVVGGALGHIYLIPMSDEISSSHMKSAQAVRSRIRTWKPHDGKVLAVAFDNRSRQISSVSETKGLSDDEDKERFSPTIWSTGQDGRVIASRPFARLPIRFLEIDDALQSKEERSEAVAKLWCRKVYNINIDSWSASDATPRFRRLIDFLDCRSSGGFFAQVDERYILRESGETLINAANDERLERFAVSDDGLLMAICIENVSERRHRIEVRSCETNELLFRHENRSSNDVCFSPDSRRVAYVFNDDVIIRDATTGRLIVTLIGHQASVRDIDFSPDGAYLASVSDDQRLIVWNVNTGRIEWSQRAHDYSATTVAFHPVLPTIATCGNDGYVRFWSNRANLQDSAARNVGEFPLSAGSPNRVEFSHEGRRLNILHSKLGISILDTSRARVD